MDKRTAYAAVEDTVKIKTLKVDARSHIVREQIIDLSMSEYDIDPDVDTVRLVVHPINGRSRTVVFHREMLRQI
jgi:hypothetical protein